MKKIMIFLSAAMFFVAFSVNAQTWEPKTAVGTGLTSVVVTADNTIFAFGDNGFKSTNQGITWTTIALPSTSVNKVISFNGKLYLATDNGLYSTPQASINWTAEFNEKMTICANDQHVFAFGDASFYRLDGNVWTQLYSLTGIIGASYETYITAADASTNRLVIYTDHAAPGYFVPMESTDQGATWTSLPNFYWDYVNDVDLCTAGYETAVGGRGSNMTLNAVGNFQFAYPTGQFWAVCYLDNHCWMGGYVGLWPQPEAKGILMADGDLATLVYTDGVVKDIATNGSLSVAITDIGSVYTRISMTMTAIDQPTQTAPTTAYLSVYPNPTEAGVNFNLDKADIVYIYGSNSSLISQQQMPAGKNQIDLSNFPPGIYFIQLGETKARAKVVKQ